MELRNGKTTSRIGRRNFRGLFPTTPRIPSHAGSANLSGRNERGHPTPGGTSASGQFLLTAQGRAAQQIETIRTRPSAPSITETPRIPPERAIYADSGRGSTRATSTTSNDIWSSFKENQLYVWKETKSYQLFIDELLYIKWRLYTTFCELLLNKIENWKETF